MAPRPTNGSVPDPISSASARLFAAGVDRRQRLVTLRFLGILLANADDEGRIHCDPDDLVGLGLLNDMLPEEVTRSRQSLEAVDAIERDPTGWLIRDFTPVGDEVPPAEAMAAIGRVLAQPVADEAPVLVPIAPPLPDPVPFDAVVPLDSVRTRRARRWLVAPVGAVAAAAVVLVALMVSGGVKVPLPGQPVSNERQAATGAASTVSPTVPGASQPSSSASPRAAGSTATPSGDQAPTSAAPAAGSASAPAVCPAGGAVATVEHMAQHVDSSVPASSFRADLPPIVRTSVSGVVRNTSSVALVAAPFPVDVNFTDPAGTTSQVVTATALAGPTTVPAGGSVPWTVTVQNPQSAPVAGSANAHTPAWRWADAGLAATCPR
jgi:hypothetical protein